MGIFSFGKKDDAPDRRGANTATRAARSERGSERVERRTRRTDRTVDADAMLLDPTLPEKQRARRRLVGAIALVVAAVVVLPMVLDSHPKPVTDDISIDIPSRPAPRLSSKADKADDDTQAGVAPDNPSTPEAASGLAPAATAGAQSPDSAKPQTADASPAKPAAKAAVAPAAKPSAPAALANAGTEPTSAKPANKPAAAASAHSSTNSNSTAPTGAAAADADSGTPASPPGSRFAVQLGAFPDDASARSWANKLKAAGVPAYTERRKQADGVTRTLLRAGPFADRAAASAAIAKVREAGLGAGANTGTAQ